jgi:TolB-like protein
MPDVFISYARSTAKEVRGVAEALKRLGYDVWWDDDLPANRAYGDVIEEHLEAAKAVVVVWSAEAVKSQWVRSEADRARQHDKLVQVSVDGAVLPMPFDQIQCVPLKGWSGDPGDRAWLKVVASVSDLTGRAGETAPPPARRGVRLTPWRLGMAALAVVGLALGVWLALGRPGWPVAGDGVAVASFDTAAGDPVARGFADQVTDQVADALAKADLKSLPSGSGGGVSAEQRDASAIRLGAALALGGRVERRGDALKVSVVIDDAQRHEILWSSDFSRPAVQAQALQEQVAARVAYVLKCALRADGASGRRISRESLRLYLQACDLFVGGDAAQVRDLFGQVVAREPNFADAWANFALNSALAIGDLPADQAAAARKDATAAAQRALQLDPGNGDAYVALATLDPGPGDLWNRQALLLKGLAADPHNARLNYRESELLGEAGRYKEAIASARRSVELDPLLPYLPGDLSSSLASDGKLLEARAIIEAAIRTWPDLDDLRSERIGMEARFGDPARALALLNDPTALPSYWEASNIDETRQYCLIRQSHDPAKVAAYAASLLAQVAAGKIDPSSAVRRLTPLGATDAAFAAAGYATPSNPLDTEMLFRPSADGMRRDPRFMPLAAKLGLVDFWRRSGVWPDFCEAPDRPYDCRAEAAKVAR